MIAAPDTTQAERAVVSDDGSEIRLTLFRGPQAVAAIALSPLRAVGIVGDLIAAAAPRRAEAPRRPRRGGDPAARKRAERDAALRGLADLVEGAPIEQQARDIAHRLARYRPLPVETTAERVLMRQVVDSGLPVPAPDRLARIIRAR